MTSTHIWFVIEYMPDNMQWCELPTGGYDSYELATERIAELRRSADSGTRLRLVRKTLESVVLDDD